MLMTSSEQDQLAGVAQMILRMLHHGAFQQVLAEGGVMPAGILVVHWIDTICTNFRGM